MPGKQKLQGEAKTTMLGRAGGYSERCREGPTLRAQRPPRDSEKDGPLEQARTDPGRVKLS